MNAGYAQGEGVVQNSAEAAKWFRMAAEQGHVFAQELLGVMYASGDGVAKNYVEAAKWFRKAAEQGDAEAQYMLSGAYFHGQGVTQNYAESVKWSRMAAEQGHAAAQFSLGVAYHGDRDSGVAKNPGEAVRWYRKAAEQGYGIAQVILARCYMDGDGVPKNEIEALAWFYITAASIGQKSLTGIETLENKLGRQASLLAQQRSKEILQKIESVKRSGATADKANKSDFAIPKFSGTGVFVADDGIILTAAHVVKGASKILVFTKQGLKKEARLVKLDAANDIAVLKCDGHHQSAPTKPSQGIKLGQSVFTIGFPNLDLQGSSPKMTKGEISSLSGYQDDPRQWQISVPVQPGNSGGPLFDEAGNVVGIVLATLNAIKTAKATGELPQNVNYALKSAYMLPLLESCGVKLAPVRSSSLQEKIENVVEKTQGSVVLVLAY